MRRKETANFFLTKKINCLIKLSFVLIVFPSLQPKLKTFHYISNASLGVDNLVNSVGVNYIIKT